MLEWTGREGPPDGQDVVVLASGVLRHRTTDMKQKDDSGSRRRTPWTGAEAPSALQAFIDATNASNYERRHPSLASTGEAEMLNGFEATCCRRCGSKDFHRYGRTRNGVFRYRCRGCGRTFCITTNTIFDGHKVSVSEWLDFLLTIFGYGSFSLTSKTNRNAYNTTRYWMDKVFLVLKGCQDGVVLGGVVFIDETYVSVCKGDVQENGRGYEYPGISRNKMCIGVGTDRSRVVCIYEKTGKPTVASTREAFAGHIERGSTLRHDREHSHGALVDGLGLCSEAWSSKELMHMSDGDNPLDPINKVCAMLKRFLRAHSGFSRCDLQDYLNLFCFIVNPPHDRFRKVEAFLNLALHLPVLHRYRG